MITIERILCPTNLSAESDEALRYAVALAATYDAKLFVFYCREGGNGNGNGSKAPLFTESLAPNLGLTKLSDLNWEGVVAHNVTDIGKAIVQEAANRQVDLIVMRSRRRPYAAALLGSTAETVSRMAHCPVLVTHPQEREWVGLTTGEIDLHRVLVAHDFSPDSELALNYGLSLAQEYQTEVHLLHVLPTEGQVEPELAWSNSATGSAYAFAATNLQRAVPKEAFLWCKLFNIVRSGKPYHEVLDYAKKYDVDLICIGASGSDRSIGKLFGSNADRVLRQSPCPVLITRSGQNVR